MSSDFHKKIRSLRGMRDVLPKDSYVYRIVESKIQKILFQYNFQEIRTPILERSDLFDKTIGKNTEVVRKEMYTFLDKNGNIKISLRPENTVGCVRAGIENGLFHNSRQRLWYSGPMFRYDRPQSGRYRQFSQIGIEMFGFDAPSFDAELISITSRIWRLFSIENCVRLEINSIGSIHDRKVYSFSLKKFFRSNLKKLDVKYRELAINDPIRLLDSKDPGLNRLLIHAPSLEEHIDKGSVEHFRKFCKILRKIGIRYTINKRLVRGLDYYNRTVFEWISDVPDFRKTICAGGRYDHLSDMLGYHRSVPSLGCAIGVERLITLIGIANRSLIDRYYSSRSIDIYLCKHGSVELEEMFFFSEKIRDQITNISIMMHYGSDKIKKQIFRANENNAKILIVLREDIYRSKKVLIQNLQKKSRSDIVHLDKLYEYFNNI
ncbi:histidine--tRNA ligase [Candidatus Riesia pediculischaeffi]|uniref:Histidine--tRNA ligase n=1 Tax=Candidatus Riesia pediculischaeffi PTSU TaxID=1401651 RepID=A0A0C1S8Y0_9ENTR|nr:histidine--tRNA ligase [Candidatus Riesia pediculischaeffi]KIE63731.1 Histidyl-tRNA synthetase [Candidatus Riesia pediculischaeffi PTSU]